MLQEMIVTAAVLVFAGCAAPVAPPPEEIPLAGTWRATAKDISGDVRLPGSLAESGLGPAPGAPFNGELTPRHYFIGPVTYTRAFTVPPALAGRPLELFLERVLWRSAVAVDGRAVPGVQDSFAAPHVHPLGALAAGRHVLAVTIDNSRIHPVTDCGHAYSDMMQTKWNGAVGRLLVRPAAAAPRVFATDDTASFVLEVPEGFTGPVLFDGRPARAAELPPAATEPGRRLLRVETTGRVGAWSPEHPELHVVAAAGASVRFGFRRLERKGTRLFLNGRSFFVRGNVDNCHFPLTGYPSCDAAEWRRILGATKREGFNLVRFHSWCPPAAAFAAADELGVFLAPESGFWINSWQAGETPIGKNADLDGFIQAEMRAILDAFGDAPSFFSLGVGNELGAGPNDCDFGAMDRWIADAARHDPRHLYFPATSRYVTSHTDYIVTNDMPDPFSGGHLCGRYRSPDRDGGTEGNGEDAYARSPVPYVAHELGQWAVYPDWREIDRYTGSLRPWNLEIFRGRAATNGLLRFNARWHRASVRSCRMLYKDEIEFALRAPSCAGFEALSMQDYSGQGEALVGWYDSFYTPKPGMEGDPFPTSSFCSNLVFLAKFPSRFLSTSEVFRATFALHNYGLDIPAGTCFPWSFGAASGKIVLSNAVPAGAVVDVGAAAVPLAGFAAPAKALLRFGSNAWELWVYPDGSVAAGHGGAPVEVVTDWPAARRILVAGGAVVYDAHANAKGFATSFKSVFWSAAWFNGRSAPTMGAVISASHPAFRGFPTDDWQNWNWRRLADRGRAFDFTPLGAAFEPLVAPVPDFHDSIALASVFEAATPGGGRLLVSGYDLSVPLPEFRALRTSFLDYAASDAFRPAATVPLAALDSVLSLEPAPRPAEFRDAAVYIAAAARFRHMNASAPWEAAFDDAALPPGASYSIQNGQVWRDAVGTYWHGAGFRITLCGFPSVRGRLRLRFRDPNHLGRTARVAFAGRTFQVPLHQDLKDSAYWLDIPVMAEDFLKGMTPAIDIRSVTGPNAMVDRLILE